MKSIKMEKYENLTSYVTMITQVRDEIATIGEVVKSNDLVRTALNGVTKQWEVFVEAVVAQDNMPSLGLSLG